MASAKNGGAGSGKRSNITWPHRVGLRPHTVTAFERSDKGNTVWLRWTVPGRSAPAKMPLGIRLRDELGRIDPDLQDQAVEAAKRAYHRLLNGEDPRSPDVQKDADGTALLTVADGLEMAMRVPTGMYAISNPHVADMRRYHRHLLTVIEPGATWADLTSVTYEQTWRKLAHLKADKGIGGKRSCELAIVLLAQAGRWLHRAGKLKVAPAEPEERYIVKLHADWHRITKETTINVAPPRHTPDEVGRLLLNVDNPAVDPRIRLVFRTAGEARLGQAIACTREHLDLGPIGKNGLGRFTIPDTGKKKGAKIDLTPELRAAWDYELTTGYLRDLEAAYQAGHRKSYPLFPGKRLVRGVARADVAKPLGDRGATDLWHQFEVASGVEVIQGRGWYGVRRTGADLAEDVESDGRALNAITGHQSDDMRRKVYQDKQRDEVLAKASTAREAARKVAIDAARAAAAERGETLAVAPAGPSHWEQMREAKRQRRRAAHAPTGTRQRPTYPPRECAQCGTEYVPTGPRSKACGTCSPRRIRGSTGTKPTPEPTPTPISTG